MAQIWTNMYSSFKKCKKWFSYWFYYLSSSWLNLLNQILSRELRTVKAPKWYANKRLSDPNWRRVRITRLEQLLGLKGSYRHRWWHRRLDPHCRLDRLLMSELLYLRRLCQEAPTGALPSTTIARARVLTSGASACCRAPSKQSRMLSINHIDSNCSNKDMLVRLQLDADVSPHNNKCVTIQVGLMGKQRSHQVIALRAPDLQEEHDNHKPINGWQRLTGGLQRLWQRLTGGLQHLWRRLWQRPTLTGSNGLKQVFDALLPDGGPYTITDFPGLSPEGARVGSRPSGDQRAHRVRQEVKSEPKGQGSHQLKYWNMQIHCFYSFSDIVALLGRRLLIAEKVREAKKYFFVKKDFLVKLPLVITDRWGVSRQVRLQIVDWSSYQSLVNTCLVYNVPLTHQDLLEVYNTRMHEVCKHPETRAVILAEGREAASLVPSGSDTY